LGQEDVVLGAAIIIAMLLVVLPAMIIMTGGLIAVILGWVLDRDAKERFAGSELLDLNR
jgi:hypothetical protein